MFVQLDVVPIIKSTKNFNDEVAINSADEISLRVHALAPKSRFQEDFVSIWRGRPWTQREPSECALPK